MIPQADFEAQWELPWRLPYAGGKIMKTTMLPEHPDAKTPAGADIRFIMDGETGNMIHRTVAPHQVSKATVHAMVSEFWYVLEGHGEIWRDNGVESCITVLVPGVSLD
jgi:mannose-6-phosphate isomerase-like protein (cupin superfamily)